MNKIKEIELNEFQTNPLYALLSRGLMNDELQKLNDYDLSLIVEMAEWELEERGYYESLNNTE